MKTARFVLSCHSVGTSWLEISLSAWVSACSFAGSLRCAFTSTRNAAAPVVDLFRASLIASCKMYASGAPTVVTSLFRLHLPIFVQLSAALDCRTNKAWVLSQGCHVMPRQRPLVPDGLSWILPLPVSPSSAAFSFSPAD